MEKNHQENAPPKTDNSYAENFKTAKKKKSMFANIWVFIFLLSMVLLTQMLIPVYTVGMTRTLEKRYGLSSAQSNTFISLPNIPFLLLVLIISYLGQTTHRPRILSACCLTFFIGCCIVISPHFLFSENDVMSGVVQNGESDHKMSNTTSGDAGHKNDADVGYCLKLDNRENTSLNNCLQETAERRSNEHAYRLLQAGFIITGFGEAALKPLGVSYIDDNISEGKTAFVLGIVSSMYAIGKVLGFVFSTFCNKLPLNLLSTPSDITPYDPRWIGCWWLGYMIFGLMALVLAPAMFFFPKSLKQPSDAGIDPAKKRYCASSIKSLISSLKAFPRALCEIVKSDGYVFLVITYVFSLYIIIALFMNIPRYNEIYFYKPAFIASLVAGITSPVGGTIGLIIGGCVMSRFKIKPPGAALMVVTGALLASVGLLANMFITCPQVSLAGSVDTHTNQYNLSLPCNNECQCGTSKKTYEPVCDTDKDVTYFSPCHAGCSNATDGVLNGCSCTSNNATLTPGQCMPDCNSKFIVYSIILLLLNIFAGSTKVPCTIIQMRIVNPQHKALSLGLGAFIYNLLCFIPGPIIFGMLVDSTCQLWETTCGKRGACLYYNNSSFRFLIHGSSLGFVTLAVLSALFLWLSIRKNKYSDSDTSVVESETQQNDTENKHMLEIT